MSEQNDVVDGTKEINSRETSKRGYPIVNTGTPVDCHHCNSIHDADFRDSDVGYWVPGGHAKHSHFKCPKTDKFFAAKAGSKLR